MYSGHLTQSYTLYMQGGLGMRPGDGRPGNEGLAEGGLGGEGWSGDEAK